MKIRAVIFDLGGVVLGSPLHAIAAFERDHDIPAGFGLRSVDIQLHADEEVVAVLMSQSSFNRDAPRYEGELLFLSASSGRVIDKVYMGARNRVLRMQRDARGLHLVRDSGVDTSVLDPSPRQ